MFRRSKKSVALVAGLTLASTLMVAAPANAVYAACGAWREENDVFGPNTFRAGVHCSRIDSDTKVRAILVRDVGVDYESGWITAEYAYAYTGWRTCWSGCHAIFQVARR